MTHHSSMSLSTQRLVTVLRPLGRGVGQIFFQPHALTGLLIVAGTAVFSPLMALQVLLGTAVATVAAVLLDLKVEEGLQGYNGALVGAAAWAATGAPWPATLLTLVGAAACPAVQQAVSRGATRAGLPALTAPFCIVSGLLTVLLHMVSAPATSTSTPLGGSTPWLVLQAVLTGISQVMLVESWIGGALILAGLFIAGWRVGTAAVLGSAVGTALTLLTTPAGQAAHGLGGYSPCLTAIAVAAVFLPDTRAVWGLAAAAAALTVAVDRVFALLPVPTYTWPFIITTWGVLVINRYARQLG